MFPEFWYVKALSNIAFQDDSFYSEVDFWNTSNHTFHSPLFSQIINYELAHYVDEENVFLEPSMLDSEFAAPELLLGRVSTTAADIWWVLTTEYVSIFVCVSLLVH